MPSNQADQRSAETPWIADLVGFGLAHAPEGRSRRGERGSPHVVNHGGDPAAQARRREQPELAGPPYGRAPAADAELGVDVLGVRAHGVERHDQLRGRSPGRSSSLASSRSTSSSRSLSGSTRASLSSPFAGVLRIVRRAAAGRRTTGRRRASTRPGQQGRHRRTLVGERARRIPPARPARARATERPSPRRCRLDAVARAARRTRISRAVPCRPPASAAVSRRSRKPRGGAVAASGEQGPRQRHVLVLAQVVGLVGHGESPRRAAQARARSGRPCLTQTRARMARDGPHVG